MPYGMVVHMQVKPERRQEFDRILERVKLRAADEDGCLAFNVHNSSEDPDCVWIYEAYVSKAYHDDEHEALPEVRDALARLPDLVSAPWEIYQGASLFD